MSVRQTVMRSLAAISGRKEAEFYTRLFRAQSPEQFALIILDQRCLHVPLLEALISDMRILSDLQLTPLLMIGALDDDRTKVRVNGQRLMKEFEKAGIKAAKLNCATYGLNKEIKRKTSSGSIVVLELTERRGAANLPSLINTLQSGKVIFLQPSGGLRRDGIRLKTLSFKDLETGVSVDQLSPGQTRFLSAVRELAPSVEHKPSYIMASPLNLLQELFTTSGSGTMIRKTPDIKRKNSYRGISKTKLTQSIEDAFEAKLNKDFYKRKVQTIFIESAYRGGAIFIPLSGLPYLSKFWVTQEARGEGLAGDVWQRITSEVPVFFWRSRRENPFNDYYMKVCDGMQVSGQWRVFWIGLTAPELPSAILAAASAPQDFEFSTD